MGGEIRTAYVRGVCDRLEVAVTHGLSREEIMALPATVDVVTACRALGLGRTLGYQLVRRGEFPCRVLRVGRRYLIPTADLRAVLGLAVPAAVDEH